MPMVKVDSIMVRKAKSLSMKSMVLTACPVFAGKDPSRALATSSLKAEDCVPDWSDLDDSAKTVLGEWYTFFSKRYNQVGKVSTSEDESMKWKLTSDDRSLERRIPGVRRE
jgi:hypothetical protein